MCRYQISTNCTLLKSSFYNSTSFENKETHAVCYTQRLLNTTLGLPMVGTPRSTFTRHVYTFTFSYLVAAENASTSLLSTSLLLWMLKIPSGSYLVPLTKIWLPTKPRGYTGTQKGGGCLSKTKGAFVFGDLGLQVLLSTQVTVGTHTPGQVPSLAQHPETGLHSSYLQNFSTSNPRTISSQLSLGG